MVSRNDDPARELGKLPVKVRTDLVSFLQRLDQIIRMISDTRSIWGILDPCFMLLYCDGAQAEGNCRSNGVLSFTFRPTKGGRLGYASQASNRDGAFFDDVRQISKQIEPKLPPTAEIQKGFRDESRRSRRQA